MALCDARGARDSRGESANDSRVADVTTATTRSPARPPSQPAIGRPLNRQTREHHASCRRRCALETTLPVAIRQLISDVDSGTSFGNVASRSGSLSRVQLSRRRYIGPPDAPTDAIERRQEDYVTAEISHRLSSRRARG